MATAVIVDGYRTKIPTEPQVLNRILQRDFCLNTVYVKASDYTPYNFNSTLRQIMFSRCSQGEVLLLAYIGHGSKDGWMIEDAQGRYKIPYKDLSWIIKIHSQHRGPVLIYNDCCKSWCLVGYLEKIGVNRRVVGAILATNGDYKAYGWELLPDLLSYWTTKTPYSPGPLRNHRETILKWPSITQVEYRSLNYRLDGLLYVYQAVVYFMKKILWDRRSDIVVSARWGAVLDEHFYKLYKRG